MAYEAETAIYNRLRQAPTFHPAGAALFVPDWTLEPGDVVTVRSGEDDYQVPVYSMDLQWQGQSRVNIQSTGNQKREPLPALQRRRYATGRTVYQQEQAIEELQEQTVEYTQRFEVSDQKVASIMTATGVLLDENNEPVIDPETGLFVFDTTSEGATLQSRIDQNASAISLEATTRADDDAFLSGRIDVESGRIGLVVTGTGQNAQVNTAGIILAINGGTGHSSAKIEADSVYIDARNQITLGDTMTVSGSTVEIMEGISGDGTLTCYTIEAYNIEADGEISAPSIQATTSASFASITIDEDDYEAKSVSIAGTTLSNLSLLGTGTDTELAIPDAITDLQVVAPSQGSNTYTLQKKTISNASWQNAGTFSRATSLNGGWSGGTYTVTATPQGESNSTTLYAIAANGDPTRSSTLQKYLNVPLKVLYDDGDQSSSDKPATGFTETISVNASLIWQDGYDAGGGGVVVNPELYIQSSWDYDSENEKYTKTVQIRDGQTVIETDYVELPDITATRVSLTKGSISMTGGTTYSGSYSVSRSSGGDVTVSGVQGAGFTVGVNALTMALELTQPTATQFTWNTSGTNAYKYTYQTDASVSVDGTANVLTRQITGLVLNPTDAVNYGKTLVTVGSTFTVASAPSGVTPTTLTSGETYKLSVTKDGTAVSGEDKYYAVPTSGTQRTASGLSDTITLSNTDIGSSVNKTATVMYDDDTETTNFPVRINASAVYGKGLQDGNTISTITVEGTDLGNPSSDSNPGSVTLNAIGADGETVVKTATYNRMYITNGTWNSSNKMAVNIRVGGDSSAYPLIARKWISAPSVSHNITCSSTVTSIGTNRGSRTNAGSISKSGLVANSYLGFTISCGGTSKSFYISVNA